MDIAITIHLDHSPPQAPTVLVFPGEQQASANGARDSRFERILENGAHVATLDHSTGLMWCVTSLGREDAPEKQQDHTACVARCKNLRLLGFDDWRLAERSEAVTIIDDTRHEPAIDTAYFPGIKPAWHRLNTAAAWSPESYAWYVGFGYGSVSNSLRSYAGFALAVRRASQ
jgi:hypothetical protein